MRAVNLAGKSAVSNDESSVAPSREKQTDPGISQIAVPGANESILLTCFGCYLGAPGVLAGIARPLRLRAAGTDGAPKVEMQQSQWSRIGYDLT
jgi:hypothetical protein